MTRFQEVISPKINAETILPTQATSRSAGSDFRVKEDITIRSGETKITFTDIKCKLNPDEVLYIYIRSSVGFNQGVVLANGTGVVDSDYFGNPDNDGNIGLPLHNYSDSLVKFKSGDRVAQGVIHKIVNTSPNYVPSTKARKGGFGSTGL